MNSIPWWARVSSAAAPVLLVGGWTLAAALQPAGYNPVRDTISALAAEGAPYRSVMTWALVGVGVSHVLTGAGLRPAGRAGRVVLAAGGVATVLVAAFPQPVRGDSIGHTAAASAAFLALAVWPAFAMRRSGGSSPMLSPATSITATVVLLSLVVWFVAELHGGHRGLAERSAAGAQALWPLAVVLGDRRPGHSR